MAWYVHAALRGRYTGAIETNLNKDLQIADSEGVDGLLSSLTKLQKGSLAIRPEDFEGVGRGARSYPLLYLLTRAEAGRDLRTGELFGTTAPSLRRPGDLPEGGPGQGWLRPRRGQRHRQLRLRHARFRR